jgi:mannose-6-phosphate isomerase-like protein (cupin superfamily)
MARVGAEIENAVSGERLKFLQTFKSSKGELFQAEIWSPPGKFVIQTHFHPNQIERFEVIEGSLGAKVAGRTQVAGPGERVSVPVGTSHSYWNDGDGELHILYEHVPALTAAELFFETYYGLSRQGSLSRKGQISPLQAAVLFAHFRDFIRPTMPPAWVQDPLFAVLAPIARRRGYRSSFPEFATES